MKMSEVENQVEQEVLEVDPIGDFIDAIATGDFNQSEKLFNDLLADKLNDSLEAEKISVADTIFNGVPEIDSEEEFEEPEMELEEPEIEAELDEE